MYIAVRWCSVRINSATSLMVLGPVRDRKQLDASVLQHEPQRVALLVATTVDGVMHRVDETIGFSVVFAAGVGDAESP